MVNNDMTITAPANIIVPGRTVQLIVGLINPFDNTGSSVLVEPSSKLPSHLCLTRSLSPLLNHTEVVLQKFNPNDNIQRVPMLVKTQWTQLPSLMTLICPICHIGTNGAD